MHLIFFNSSVDWFIFEIMSFTSEIIFAEDSDNCFSDFLFSSSFSFDNLLFVFIFFLIVSSSFNNSQESEMSF